MKLDVRRRRRYVKYCGVWDYRKEHWKGGKRRRDKKWAPGIAQKVSRCVRTAEQDVNKHKNSAPCRCIAADFDTRCESVSVFVLCSGLCVITRLNFGAKIARGKRLCSLVLLYDDASLMSWLSFVRPAPSVGNGASLTAHWFPHWKLALNSSLCPLYARHSSTFLSFYVTSSSHLHMLDHARISAVSAYLWLFHELMLPAVGFFLLSSPNHVS